jgi:hypothetical protein
MQYRDVLARVLTPLWALCLTSTMAAHSIAEDVNIKEFYKMLPRIQQVRQICPWRSATTQGTIRLMQIEEGGAHRLYVQWLRQGIAGTAEAPLSTISIKEINDDKYFRFDLPDGRLMAGACSIETIMEDIVDERRFRLTLYLMGPGKYEVHMTRLLDGGIKLPLP